MNVRSYQSHESSSNSNQRTGGDDDQRQLPPFNEANAEAAYKGGEALHKDGHLVGDGIVDLVDVAVKKKQKKTAKTSEEP